MCLTTLWVWREKNLQTVFGKLKSNHILLIKMFQRTFETKFRLNKVDNSYIIIIVKSRGMIYQILSKKNENTTRIYLQNESITGL